MIKLYGHAKKTSSNSLKLRAALAEAGADYEYVPVDLGAGEQKTPAFLALNPHGKIPVLQEDAFVLAESDAILWYIAERFPAARLLPAPATDGGAPVTQAQARARVLQWCDFTSTGLYQTYLDLSIHALSVPSDRTVSWIADAARAKMDRLLGVMETVLDGRDNDHPYDRQFLAGDFSIADLAAASVLRSIKVKMPADATAGRARVAAWYERVTSRPAWRKVIEET
jgi:glutathione S-transferase